MTARFIISVRAAAAWMTLCAMAPVSQVPPASDAEIHHVQANFCNLLDAKGRVIFTPFAISLPEDDRADWLRRQREAGSTHTVLSPAIAYEGSPIPGRDLYADPAAFAGYVREALRTPSASGKGFTPILILDNGKPGMRERINRFWPGIRAALGDDVKRVIVVPGWELVSASAVTSADLSYAIGKLHDLGFPHIWLHLSPGRVSGASSPLERDDPWRGDHIEFWKKGTGRHLEGLLWQSQAVRPHDDACNPADEACWLNRWADVVPRLGKGTNGWRAVHLAYFEGPAYHFYRGKSDSAFAVRIANAAKTVCDKHGVKCGFGNGLPR